MKHWFALHGYIKYSDFHCYVACCKQIFTYENQFKKKHLKNSEDCVKEIKQKYFQQDNGKEKRKMQSESYELNVFHESKQSVPITSNFNKS